MNCFRPSQLVGRVVRGCRVFCTDRPGFVYRLWYFTEVNPWLRS